MNQAMWGALATICWVAGLFFVKFWRAAGERLFLFFAVAFWALGANWLYLAAVNPPAESHHYVYLLRLAAFAIIIAGVFDKNRRAARRARGGPAASLRIADP